MGICGFFILRKANYEGTFKQGRYFNRAFSHNAYYINDDFFTYRSVCKYERA